MFFFLFIIIVFKLFLCVFISVFIMCVCFGVNCFGVENSFVFVFFSSARVLFLFDVVSVVIVFCIDVFGLFIVFCLLCFVMFVLFVSLFVV